MKRRYVMIACQRVEDKAGEMAILEKATLISGALLHQYHGDRGEYLHEEALTSWEIMAAAKAPPAPILKPHTAVQTYLIVQTVVPGVGNILTISQDLNKLGDAKATEAAFDEMEAAHDARLAEVDSVQ